MKEDTADSDVFVLSGRVPPGIGETALGQQHRTILSKKKLHLAAECA